MSATVSEKLEGSRQLLLDLGLRNPLLNYRISTARGVHIVHEKSASIYDILVRQGKAMTFLPKPEKHAKETEALFEFSDEELQEAYVDVKLQTNETEAKLQSRMLNTYYTARTCLEEQGVNVLYIALGMLQWYESESSQEERLAPLVLIPVTIERSNARERFRVKFTSADVEGNLSLQAKMKAEFGLSIPALPDDLEDFDLEVYYESVRKIIRPFSRWSIKADSIELGFFSFGKFMIYHDLDSNKWPEGLKPFDHGILTALLEGGFKDQPLTVSEDAFIDKETKANQLFQVVDADSSQILTMLAVHEGRNLAVQGPPGTGKSQTITNLIADAIGNGKSVLFVAEKMAALEVVKRRLDSIGLGEACLELHSHKANKKELHQELRKILELGKPMLTQLQNEVALIDEYRQELNDYCSAVNTIIGESGITAQQAMGYLLQISHQKSNVNLPRIEADDISRWNTLRIQQAETYAERIQAQLKENGVPEKLLFWGSAIKFILPADQEQLSFKLREAIDHALKLSEASREGAVLLNVSPALSRSETLFHANTLDLLHQCPTDINNANVRNSQWSTNNTSILKVLEKGKALSKLKEQYKEIFLEQAWTCDVLPIRQEILAYGDKWWRFLKSSYNKAVKSLAGLCKGALPKELSSRLKYIDDILEYQKLREQVESFQPEGKDLYGQLWRNLENDWASLTAIANYLYRVHIEVAESRCHAEIITCLASAPNKELTRQKHEAITNCSRMYESSLSGLLDHIHLNQDKRFKGSKLIDFLYSEQLSLLNEWVNRVPEIHQVIAWNNIAETVEEAGYPGLIKASVSWEEARSDLKIALQKTWYEHLLQMAFTTHPVLRKFERSSHEEVVQKFRKLDQLNLQYNRAKAALKHWESVPRAEAGGQVSILRTEFNRKARHKPIRKLVQEAGLAIQKIKPVFMMSPLSIANFLPQGAINFDLVIFDEASQVKPVEAFGAILRGKQAVVVGDNKQLPPTSFFDSLTSEPEDEDNPTTDIQSILGMFDAQDAPRRMLRWHYRSRHESLITLSNHEFYENKLVIFPSPGSRYRMGLAFHHLPNTWYDRGKTRANIEEANAVADAVMAHATRHPGVSLGVVAFSTAQRQAIEDAIEQRRRKSPETEAFFNTKGYEPFFVKNLENVQGDERDVIFISIGYGRTKEGFVTMSFGPLNNEGGERRLNVLITRAKMRCEVFTNLTADDIDISRTKAYGVRALKSFLYYAQHGRLDVPVETGRSADSPFEDNVAKRLSELGYIVRQQVGSKGFYIDMAIVDPDHPGRYLVGIECDGASYHSARSARDRDRLRQQVLEAVGWKIHRIWSTDWFKNPVRELKRVVESIEQARQIANIEDTEADKQQAELAASIITREENSIQEVESAITYQLATLPEDIGKTEFHLHSVGRLAKWLTEVVKTESPIHFDEVARRMVEAAGITRVGSRIKECLAAAAKAAEASGKIKINSEFLWCSTMQKPIVRERSNLPAASRKLNLIAQEEIAAAIEKVVKNSIAIQPEAAVPYVAKLFGFSRVTEEMKASILNTVNWSIDQKIIQKEGELLKPV